MTDELVRYNMVGPIETQMTQATDDDDGAENIVLIGHNLIVETKLYPYCTTV